MDQRRRILVLLELEMFDQVADEARRALRQDPGDTEAHRALAWALWKQTKTAQAESPARTALSLAPASPDAHSTLAMICLDLDKLEEAGAHCEAAIALAPTLPALHTRYGLFCLRVGRWQDALRETEEALRLAPGNVEALIVHANALLWLGRLSEAEESAMALLDSKPNLPDAHHVLGLIYQERDQVDQALASFREALRLDPTNEAHKKALAGAVEAKLPIVGLLWRGSASRSRLLVLIYLGSLLAGMALLVVAYKVDPRLSYLACAFSVFSPWILFLGLRVIDRTLTAAVIGGRIK